MSAPLDVDRFLPLKPPVFQILLVLAEKERHGYAILKAVERFGDPAVSLETGPLYRHLHRLFENGLVAEAARSSPTEDPRRRTYHLTSLGSRVLQAETDRLARLVARSRRLHPSAQQA